MVFLSQAQDAGSMQQQHIDLPGESPVCCEGREQREARASGSVTCSVEIPAQHPAEVATLEADSPSTRPEQEPSLSLQPVADKQEEAAPQATPDSPKATPYPPPGHA